MKFPVKLWRKWEALVLVWARGVDVWLHSAGLMLRLLVELQGVDAEEVLMLEDEVLLGEEESVDVAAVKVDVEVAEVVVKVPLWLSIESDKKRDPLDGPGIDRELECSGILCLWCRPWSGQRERIFEKKGGRSLQTKQPGAI